MLNEMVGERLQEFIARAGYAKSLLHFGPKRTTVLEAELAFQTDSGVSRYYQRLVHAAGDRFIFAEERLEFHKPGFPEPQTQILGAGHRESELKPEAERDNKTAKVIRALLSACRVSLMSNRRAMAGSFPYSRANSDGSLPCPSRMRKSH